MLVINCVSNCQPPWLSKLSASINTSSPCTVAVAPHTTAKHTNQVFNQDIDSPFSDDKLRLFYLSSPTSPIGHKF